MIQRLFLRDFLTLADRSDQVSDVLHIVSQASYPAVTSSACYDSVTPNGWSSVSAIHNVTLHVARSSPDLGFLVLYKGLHKIEREKSQTAESYSM